MQNSFTAQLKAIEVIVMDSGATVDQADSQMSEGAGSEKKKFLLATALTEPERTAVERGCNRD